MKKADSVLVPTAFQSKDGLQLKKKKSYLKWLQIESVYPEAFSEICFVDPMASHAYIILYAIIFLICWYK